MWGRLLTVYDWQTAPTPVTFEGQHALLVHFCLCSCGGDGGEGGGLCVCVIVLCTALGISLTRAPVLRAPATYPAADVVVDTQLPRVPLSKYILISVRCLFAGFNI